MNDSQLFELMLNIQVWSNNDWIINNVTDSSIKIYQCVNFLKEWNRFSKTKLRKLANHLWELQSMGTEIDKKFIEDKKLIETLTFFGQIVEFEDKLIWNISQAESIVFSFALINDSNDELLLIIRKNKRIFEYVNNFYTFNKKFIGTEKKWGLLTNKIIDQIKIIKKNLEQEQNQTELINDFFNELLKLFLFIYYMDLILNTNSHEFIEKVSFDFFSKFLFNDYELVMIILEELLEIAKEIILIKKITHKREILKNKMKLYWFLSIFMIMSRFFK